MELPKVLNVARFRRPRVPYSPLPASACGGLSLCLAHLALWISVGPCVSVFAQAQQPALITSLKVKVGQNRLEVHIEADRMLSIKAMVLADPDRIVLDAAGAICKVAKSQIQVNSGQVKSVRMKLLQAQPPVTRIVVDTLAPLQFALRTEHNSAFLEITVPTAPQPAAVIADQAPAPPRVKYEQGLLTITAENSSLAEILNAVHSQTGAATEFPAAAANERATVKLGPAPLTSVLAALLLGSPFDYVISGSGDEPGSLQIVISEKTGHSDAPAPASASASVQAPASVAGGSPVQSGAEISSAGQSEAGGSSEAVQLLMNQTAMTSAAAAAAAENLYTPETPEVSPDDPPRPQKPSREGPRIRPPGKGKSPQNP